MGYIPAPARGVLTISAVEPKNNVDTAWWDTASGKLRRFSGDLTEWVPDGEPFPGNGWHATLLGRGHYPADIATTGVTAAGSVAIGDAQVSNSYAVAIGDSSEVGDNAPRSVVIGYTAHAGRHGDNAYAGSSVVIGDTADGDAAGTSIIIGASASAHTTGNIAIGYQASAGDPANYGASNLALGYEANAQGSSCVAIGYQAGIHQPASGAAANALSVGYGALSSGEGGGAAAFGYNADAAGMRSTALGQSASCDAAAPDSIAIGSYAKALHDSSAAIGNSVQTTTTSQLMVGMSELHVKEKWTASSSLVLHSPSGAAWRISVTDAGALSVAAA